MKYYWVKELGFTYWSCIMSKDGSIVTRISVLDWCNSRSNTATRVPKQLFETDDNYSRPNTAIRDPIQLSEAQQLSRPNTANRSPIHLSEAQYGYLKPNTAIWSLIKLSKTKSAIRCLIELSETHHIFLRPNTAIRSLIRRYIWCPIQLSESEYDCLRT